MTPEADAGQQVIATGQFVLRPPVPEDAALMELHAGDPRVARMTRSIPHPLPPGAAEEFIRRSLDADRGEDVWVVDGSGHGGKELLGVIGLERMDRGRSEIGYWVAPAVWNTGIATMAVEALVAANPQRARAIFGSVFQDNPASARVLTNCGFTYLGDAEAFSAARGASVPTWTYSKRLAARVERGGGVG